MDKSKMNKRAKTYYKTLNGIRLSMSIGSIILYLIAVLNIEMLFIINVKTTVLLGFILTGFLTLTYLVDHDKHANYYIVKRRK